MQGLPLPATIEDDWNVKATFYDIFFQGKDQAAVKGGHCFAARVPFLLFVGPYWTHVEYGLFTT